MSSTGTLPNPSQDAGIAYTRRLRIGLQLRTFFQFLSLFLYGASALHPWAIAIAKQWSNNFYIQIALCWIPIWVLFATFSFIFSYYGFYVDRKFGLSKTSFRVRFLESCKANAVTFVFGCLILEIIFASFRFSASVGWLLAGTLCAIVYLQIERGLPWLLALFYPVTVLSDVSLHERLTRLVARAGITVGSILEWRISTRTRQANALVAGVGNARRILLTDTLINELSPDEVEAIIAHELGHCALHHVWKRALLRWALFCGIFWIINASVHSGLVLFVNENAGWVDLKLIPGIFLFWQLGHIYGNLLIAALARRQEKAADLYSWKLIGGTKHFISAMQKLTNLNLIVYDRNAQWKYMHPPTPDRIMAAEQYEREHSNVASTAQVGAG